MSLTSKLTNSLSEYFFGPGIPNHYEQQRRFYQNFILDSKKLKRKLREIKTLEIGALIFEKALPNLIFLSSIAYSIFRKEPKFLWGIGISETVRATCMLVGYNNRKEEKETKKCEIERLQYENKSENPYKLRDKIRREGEEWREGEEQKEGDDYFFDF